MSRDEFQLSEGLCWVKTVSAGSDLVVASSWSCPAEGTWRPDPSWVHARYLNPCRHILG